MRWVPASEASVLPRGRTRGARGPFPGPVAPSPVPRARERGNGAAGLPGAGSERPLVGVGSSVPARPPALSSRRPEPQHQGGGRLRGLSLTPALSSPYFPEVWGALACHCPEDGLGSG